MTTSVEHSGAQWSAVNRGMIFRPTFSFLKACPLRLSHPKGSSISYSIRLSVISGFLHASGGIISKIPLVEFEERYSD